MNKISENDLVEIRFNVDHKDILLNASRYNIQRNDYVVVEAEKGEDIGLVLQMGFLVALKWKKKGGEENALRKIVRLANEEDKEKANQKKKETKEAFDACKQKIVAHNLPMKLVDVEIQFDKSKFTFFFTAEERVDFRELVKELASIYRTRIELRQIGFREEARRIGGYGKCGLKQCCTTFISDFEQITTQMARDQRLSTNPSKISGNCGRLLCCLRYELGYYQEMNEKCPKAGTHVKTEKGNAIVLHTNYLDGKVEVKYDSGDTGDISWDECHPIQASSDSSDGQNVKG